MTAWIQRATLPPLRLNLLFCGGGAGAMRFTVGMKCPDALERAIEEAAEGEVGGPSDSEEHDIAFQDAVEKAKAVAAKWFKYGEFIRVTVDTDAGTCVVESA